MNRPALYAVAAAILFGIGAPFSKILVGEMHPVALAGFLYIGAFLGLGIYSLARSSTAETKQGAPLSRDDAPWLAGAMLAGGVAAPILLMVGLTMTAGLTASLLLNLEVVATASIAVMVFRENAGVRLWLSVACMASGGVLLSWDVSEGRFEPLGPALIIASMFCWGIDNNLTRRISSKDPVAISSVKGAVSGLVSMAIAVVLGASFELNIYLLFALIIGALSYGASLVFFIKALEGMGASRTGALFGMAPFVGAVASIFLLREWLGWIIFPAMGLMAIGAWLVLTERHGHVHRHEKIEHAHAHTHDDGHHGHAHPSGSPEPHTHEHTHEDGEHEHPHWPDTHHRHGH